MAVAQKFGSSYAPPGAEAARRGGGDAIHAPRGSGTSAFRWAAEERICPVPRAVRADSLPARTHHMPDLYLM